MKVPMEGGCRCAETRIRITRAPMMATACHCTGCQTMSASAFSLTLMVPADGFEVIRGEPVIGGLKHADAQHFFCPNCLSWMFTRPAGVPLVNVRPTMLDDHSDFAPYAETYVSEKLPWAVTGAVRSFEKFPDPSEYGALMAEYAAWAK